MTPSISAEDLTKTYTLAVRDQSGRLRRTRRDALAGLTFTIDEGEVVGVIGRNGAGKTTLLKILSRIVAPTRGRAVIRGRVAALLEVGTGMHPEMTGLENIYLNGALLGMSRQEVAKRLDDIVVFAGVSDYLHTPIKRYSSGMQLRLAFAVAAHLSAEVMIVDEVLAVGDAEFQEKCLRVVRGGRTRARTSLYVSHNLASIMNICTRAIWLDRGAIRASGPPADVIAQYRSAISDAAGLTSQTWSQTDSSASLESPMITRATVSSPGRDLIVQGRDLLFTVGVRSDRRLRGAGIMVAIERADGSPVCAFSSYDHRCLWELPSGESLVTLLVPEARLLAGEHRASLYLYEAIGANIDLLDEVVGPLAFNVCEADVLGTGAVLPVAHNRGVTWMPGTFSVARMAGQEDSTSRA
jgi:lipopolysaccharide transport system ATP-binding protein